MSEPFIGEIRIFAGNFAPRGWAFCAGQLLPIAQNTALFSLLGTIYGGDGQTTFGLPDLRGRTPTHFGVGNGQSYTIGEIGGAEQVTLLAQQMPIHTHPLAGNDTGTNTSPTGNVMAGTASLKQFAPPETANTTLNAPAVGITGGNQPHENRSPTLTLNFIIALEGIFPSRN